MRRLKEPLRDNRTQQEQDAVIDVLARAATSDPSPVLRLAAIEALGRFEDPRAAGILVIAYQNAHGRNVYVRPKGEHHLSLVDDITVGAIRRMKDEGFAPAVVVETSAGNSGVPSGMSTPIGLGCTCCPLLR